MKVIIRPIAILVAHSLIMAQLTTGQPATVAFAGVKVENVEPWVEKEFQEKMKRIFEDIDSELLILPETVQSMAGSQVDSLFSDISDPSFRRVADQLEAKYVFAGKFKNVSPDNQRIMIQGDFYRYNAQLNTSFRYEVLKYYERMNDETKVIKTQLVDSLPAVSKPASFKQIAMVFGTVILVGILFMSITGTKVWGESTGGGGSGPPSEA